MTFWMGKTKIFTEWQLWDKLPGRRATVTEMYKCFNSARPIVPVNAQRTKP